MCGFEFLFTVSHIEKATKKYVVVELMQTLEICAPYQHSQS